MALYKGLLFDKSQPAPSTAEIARLEKLLGCPLPQDYKDFLQSCNGGHLEYFVHVPVSKDRRDLMCYGSFYAVDEGEWGTLPYELIQARRRKGFPSERVFPIARDGGGSELFLDLRGSGKVVAYVEGLPAWTGSHGRDALVPVADSFDGYLAGLTIPDDIALDHLKTFTLSEDAIRATEEWLDTRCAEWRTKFGPLLEKRVKEELGRS